MIIVVDGMIDLHHGDYHLVYVVNAEKVLKFLEALRNDRYVHLVVMDSERQLILITRFKIMFMVGKKDFNAIRRLIEE